jgi:hypothetical protein
MIKIKKIMARLLIILAYLLTSSSMSGQVLPNGKGSGVIFLSDVAYASLPRPNWQVIQGYSSVTPAPDGTFQLHQLLC